MDASGYPSAVGGGVSVRGQGAVVGKDRKSSKQSQEQAAGEYQLPVVAWDGDDLDEPAAAPVAAGGAGAAVASAPEPAAEAQTSAEPETAAEEPTVVAAGFATLGLGAVPRIAETEAAAEAAAAEAEAKAAAVGETVIGRETAEVEEPTKALPAVPAVEADGDAAGAEGAAEAEAGAGAGADAASTAAAGAAADADADGQGAVEIGVEAEGRTRRISKPMIAAAALTGLVLVGLPVVLSTLGGGGSHHGAGGNTAPLGFTQQNGGNGSGFVPGALPQSSNSASSAGTAAGHAAGTTGGGSHNGGATSGGPGANNGSGGHSSSGGPGSPANPGTTSGNTGHPGTGPTTPPAPNATAGAPAAATWSGVAGYGCTNAGTGINDSSGWFNQGRQGWQIFSTGGMTADNCNGNYVTVSMSGSNSDDGNYFLWTFNTGPVTSGNCDIQVYIPNDGNVMAVGGNPTYYTVQSTFSAGSGTEGSFNISQVNNLGQWIDEGSFPVSNGQIAVMLHTRGEDWNSSGKTWAHHAASAVSASCTA